VLTTDDRVALTDLVHRYAAYVDARDLGAATSLFTHDGILSTPDPPEHLGPVQDHVGHGAIHEALATVASVERTFHEVVGVVLGEDADEARGSVACVAHHLVAHDEGTTDHVWHLRYDDTYRRTTDGWLLARRALHVAFLEARKVRA
jgi:ketosteroid isomerase-like protein